MGNATLTMCLVISMALLHVMHALPPNIKLRSTHAEEGQQNETGNWLLNTDESYTVHYADEIFCDLVLRHGDIDGDEKLSASEIRDFYMNQVGYHLDVATAYGEWFVTLADINFDGLLDRNELLNVIVLMEARTNTRR